MTVVAESTLFLKQIIICIHCIIIGRSLLGIALQNLSLDKAFVILDSETVPSNGDYTPLQLPILSNSVVIFPLGRST